MSNINLRKMMVPKKEPLFLIEPGSKMTDIHPIQTKMREFFADNPRAVVTAPRRSGKSVFLIQQALLARRPVLIVTHNAGAAGQLTMQLKQFCKDNEIPYNDRSERNDRIFGIEVGNNNIKVVPASHAHNFILSGHWIVFIDEYDLVHLEDLPLRYMNTALLIGTATGRSAELREDQIGLFAGLNVNGD